MRASISCCSMAAASPISAPADAVVGEALLADLLGLEDVAAVEDDRPAHHLAQVLEVRAAELVPFGDEEEPVRALGGVVAAGSVEHAVAEVPPGRHHRDRVVALAARPHPDHPLTHL